MRDINVARLPNAGAVAPARPETPTDADLLRWMLAALAPLEPWTPGHDAAIELGLAVGRGRIHPASTINAGLIRLALIVDDADQSTQWRPCSANLILGAWDSAYAPLAPPNPASLPQWYAARSSDVNGARIKPGPQAGTAREGTTR